MRKKVGFKMLVGALCVATSLSLAACVNQEVKGDGGTTWLTGTTAPAQNSGANGDFYLNTETFELYVKADGVWVSQGSLKGEQAPETAVLLFTDSYGAVTADPIVTPVGSKVTLPTPQKYAYEFVNWTYNGKVIDNDTVIDKSMTLTEQWKGVVEIAPSYDNEFYAGELMHFEVDYGGYDYLDLDSITFNGTKYTIEEAEAADILLQYDDYIDDYDYDEYTGIRSWETVLRLGKEGSYTVTYGMDFSGATGEYSFELDGPKMSRPMELVCIEMDSSKDAGVYQNGDTVTLYDTLNRPEARIEMTFTAPMFTEFEGTYNGESVPITVAGNGYASSYWYVTMDMGTFDEAVTENVFQITATNPLSGSVTATFTVNLAQAPQENVLMHNSYNKTVTYGTDYYNEFEQVIQLYDALGLANEDYAVTNVLTNASGTEVSSSFITSTVEAFGMTQSVTNEFTLSSSSTLPVGEYTLKTTIKSTDADKPMEIKDVTATFYSAPNWKTEDTTYYIGEEATIVHTLADEAQSIVLGGTKLTKDVESTIKYLGETMKVVFAVADGKTTLTFKMTPQKENDSYNWMSCVVDNGKYEYKTELERPYVKDFMYVKMQIDLQFSMYRYALETYFATEIKTEGNPLKAMYDSYNVNVFAMTKAELDAWMKQEPVKGVEQYMEETLLPEGKTIEEYYQEAKEKILKDSPFDEQVVIFFDRMFGGLLQGEIPEGMKNNYDKLFDLGMKEAPYLADGGATFAQIVCTILGVEDMIVYEKLPADLKAAVLNALAARDAYFNALATNADDALELRDAFVAETNEMIQIFISYETGGPVGPTIRV